MQLEFETNINGCNCLCGDGHVSAGNKNLRRFFACRRCCLMSVLLHESGQPVQAQAAFKSVSVVPKFVWRV